MLTFPKVTLFIKIIGRGGGHGLNSEGAAEHELFLPCSWGLARTNTRRGTRYVLLSVGAQSSNSHLPLHVLAPGRASNSVPEAADCPPQASALGAAWARLGCGVPISQPALRAGPALETRATPPASLANFLFRMRRMPPPDARPAASEPDRRKAQTRRWKLALAASLARSHRGACAKRPIARARLR